MNLEDVLSALRLPASCRVDQRVPKKMLVENGAATSADIRAWNPSPATLEQSLFAHQDHLVEGRSESDVLYELLIKMGLDLCVPITQRIVAGKDVHSVGGGVLMACLAARIEVTQVEVVAEGIVAWRRELAPAGDTTCVFRDSAFADDVAKTNMVAILSQNGIQTVRSL